MPDKEEHGNIPRKWLSFMNEKIEEITKIDS